MPWFRSRVLQNERMARTLDSVDWPVRTERLLIRPATAADVEPTWLYRRLESVSLWMTSSSTELEDYRAHFGKPERLRKTLIMERDGAIIGDLMLAVEDAWAQAEVQDLGKGVQAEIGWCIDPAYGGRGLATEGVRALIGLAFERLELRRLTANCFADNEPSWRLMERVGMRRETHSVRDSLHRSGQWLDGMTYALLAEEWRG
jgi:RimJ/RimL family protein N-acetyltransferase